MPPRRALSCVRGRVAEDHGDNGEHDKSTKECREVKIDLLDPDLGENRSRHGGACRKQRLQSLGRERGNCAYPSLAASCFAW